MLELNQETAAAAAERARNMRPGVSRLSDSEVAVTCDNPAHPGGHVARFERRADGTLWGECALRDGGALCPAALSRRVCYHLAAGVALFLALEARAGEADPDAAVEDAVKLGGALPGWNGRFENWRKPRRPEPDGHPDAVLVARRACQSMAAPGLGPLTIPCAPGVRIGADIQERVNVTRRALGMREVVYVTAEVEVA